MAELNNDMVFWGVMIALAFTILSGLGFFARMMIGIKNSKK